jgi:hypothetical protein
MQRRLVHTYTSRKDSALLSVDHGRLGYQKNKNECFNIIRLEKKMSVAVRFFFAELCAGLVERSLDRDQIHGA